MWSAPFPRPVLFVVILLPLCGASITYFISSTTGDDANAGTSAVAPWRSLNRTARLQFGPGDGVLLRRGDTWADQALRAAFMQGPGAVLGAYGNESLPRPRILASRGASAAGVACVELLDPDQVTVQGLHLQGCFRGLVALYTAGGGEETQMADPLLSATGPQRSGLLVQGCFFSDIRFPYGMYNPSSSAWGAAVFLTGAGVVGNVTLRGNVAVRVDTFYQAQTFVDGLLMDGNTVAQCGYNCVSLGGTDMHMRNSVFLRDTPPDLFMYGTTDVIVGTVTGDNSIEDTDFNQRGEFEGGPDGCAVDFETSATGFTVSGCTFFRSFGGGIMIFGHATTSHGLVFADNRFVFAGCIQIRNDRAGIAVMCPGGNRPDGAIVNNTFVTCPGVPAIFVNPAVKGCGSNMTISGNSNSTADAVVAQPQISFSPPSPTSTAATVLVPVLAATETPNATLRYTLDGSRPTPTSPVLPAAGIVLAWPGPNLVVNVRGFCPGMAPSITNGAVVERALYAPRGEGGLRSSMDPLALINGSWHAHGWAVDASLPRKGWPPLLVALTVDYDTPLGTVTANQSRPDLVPKEAPNPDHGFSYAVPVATVATGKHFIDAWVVGGSPGCTVQPCRLAGSPRCLCGGKACAC